MRYDIEDLGSELMVKAGPFEIEWSYGSWSFGWLYVNKEEFKSEVMPDADFEGYDLKKTVEHSPAGNG